MVTAAVVAMIVLVARAVVVVTIMVVARTIGIRLYVRACGHESAGMGVWYWCDWYRTRI